MGIFKKLNAALGRALERLTLEETIAFVAFSLILSFLGLFFLGLALTPQDDLLAKIGLREVQMFTALFTTFFLICCAAQCVLLRVMWREGTEVRNEYISESTTSTKVE